MHKIYVRWNAEGEGTHRVELTLDGKPIQSYITSNEDRLYGYCAGTVSTLNRLGISIDMPNCLGGREGKRHLCANHGRED